MSLLKLPYLTLVAVCSLITITCSTSKQSNSLSHTTGCEPEWVSNVPAGNTNVVYVVGIETSPSYNLATRAARANAQRQAGQFVSMEVSTVSNNWIEQNREALNDEMLTAFKQRYSTLQKVVTDQVVQEVTLADKKACKNNETGMYTGYVLLKFPRQQLRNTLEKSVANDSTINALITTN